MDAGFVFCIIYRIKAIALKYFMVMTCSLILTYYDPQQNIKNMSLLNFPFLRLYI